MLTIGLTGPSGAGKGVIASLLGFLGVLAYIACALIIPEKPDSTIIDAE